MLFVSPMKTHEFSFNSLADLNRQIEAVGEACLDATQVGQARRRGTDLDNNGKNFAGERVTLKIDYIETA